ncbi:LPS assembly protein LptD [Aliiroseovarius sp.]|uniref:LPS-assembly protein LptD n=1 Tax=Aliiroseovarius sp. TaxID=1872442 RepID=UPI00262346A9|nr:LPS assembly protein LptD [Aliiroseovarius sp.]
MALRLRSLLATLSLCVALPLAAPALSQSAPATLVADSMRATGPGRIEASGNVVVLYQNMRLSAARVSYDRATDRLEIEGPITLTQADGSMIVLADSAELSTDMADGIMQSARVVLDQQLQIAAAELNRVGGRYTQASKVIASSCEVCLARPTPLWEIRAREVVHDAVERQLYFTNAQFRVMGVPIFWLPRLRLPDPTLDRATGFLAPRLSTSTRLGKGLRTPYFIRLGDHADLTVTPFLTSKTNTVELRYRQAFTKGRITLNGAISDDELLPGQTRWYLFGSGQFEVGRDFQLEFGIEQVSDASYLTDYNYTDADRLESHLTLSRTRRDEFILAGLTQYETLRADEIANSGELPFGQAEFLYERRFDGALGGGGFWQVFGDSYWRESDNPVGGAGRDGARLSLVGEWRRDWVLSGGIEAELRGRLDADSYWIWQDDSFDTNNTHVTPAAGLTLRYPMSRTTGSGALEVLEPVAQLAWSDRVGAGVPNEDSTLVEFDETNLFALDRFPGQDAHERGTRAALGVTWTRFLPGDWTYALAAGRVWHQRDLGQFSTVSGLSGNTSDWLVAGQVQLADRFALQARTLLGDDSKLNKSEVLAMFQNDRVAFATGHIWVAADLAEDRDAPVNEWSWDSTFQINDNWQASADWRYDLGLDNLTKAGFGLEYSNECVTIDLSLSRRFTSSTSVKPTTNIGFGVSLNGFGGRRGTQRSTCVR